MEMKIDDYIKIIKSWLYKGTNGLTNIKLGYMEGWFHKTDKEAFETAITIMHKYQKIEQILDDCDLEAWEVLEKVKEVLKDGNDN